ncbi:MAG: DinB family protein [Acidobacteriota bacterium]
MHPRIQELLAYLTSAGVHLTDAVEAVPREQRDIKPAADRWSVAEVLEHLSIVETNIAKLIAKRVAEGRAAGVGPERETRTVLWTLDSARVLDRRERIEAADPVQPRAGLDADAAMAALSKAQAAIRDAVVAADGLALGEITHPHRTLGPLDMYQWIVFTATHEMRHILQIREIGASLKSAAPAT